jgi:hypothetical protein
MGFFNKGDNFVGIKYNQQNYNGNYNDQNQNQNQNQGYNEGYY